MYSYAREDFARHIDSVYRKVDFILLRMLTLIQKQALLTRRKEHFVCGPKVRFCLS